MKFIVKQADLKEALNKLVRITSKQIPVYKNIRVEKLSNDRLLLSSTNGILSMQIKLPAIDIEGEAIAIDARRFNDVVNRLEGNITFNDGVISANKSRVKLEISTAEFEISTDKTDEYKKYEMPVDFLNSLKSKIFATRKEGGVLAGISIKEDEVCATNSVVLALQKTKVSIDSKVIISTEFARELSDCIDEEFTLIINKNRIFAETNNITIISNIIDGQFPNYNALIPQNYTKSFCVDKSLLLKSLELMLLLKGTESIACRFKVSNNQLTLETRSNNNEGSTLIDVDYTGEETEFAFNTEQIISVLNNIESDVITIKFEDYTRPVLLTDDNSNTILIMPMRVK